MKNVYVSPKSEAVELLAESIIAQSLKISNDHADGDFKELSNKKSYEKHPIWD